jgi:uncharacterized protein YbcI
MNSRVLEGQPSPPPLAPGIWPDGSGLVNADLARAIVRCYRAHLGRGPEKTKAFYKDDVVVVVMQRAMTRAEQTLVTTGNDDAVHAMRRAVNETVRTAIAACVEDVTTCKVVAMTSAVDPAADVVSCVFLMDRPVPARRFAATSGTSEDR